MEIQPYLFFEGRCEEALAFYKATLGAEVTMLMRFGEMPDPQPGMIPPGGENKIMHASFRVGPTTLNASDGHCAGNAAFKGFGLSLYAADVAEANRLFGALGDGGEVRMPMSPTFFASAFGMVSDKFGVTWMVITASTEQKAAA